MDKAAKVVSDAILGIDVKYISLHGKVFSVKPPSLKTVLMAIHHLSEVDVADNQNVLSVLFNQEKSVKALARAIAIILRGGDGIGTWWLARWIMRNTSFKEVKEVFEQVIPLLGGADFFAIASLSKNCRKIAAVPR